jgi:hypothetical protein
MSLDVWESGLMEGHKKGQSRIGLARINDVFFSNRMLPRRLSVAAEVNFLY